MPPATGIHAHDSLKLGRQPPSGKPRLRFESYLDPRKATESIFVNHFGKGQYVLGANDRFGTCGPTALANVIVLVSTALAPAPVVPTDDDIFDLYRRSSNPDFDPATGADDNGVDLQTMLEAALTGGLAGVKPLCFGSLPAHRDDLIIAAIALFGGVIFGGDLQVSQQDQSQAEPAVWDNFAPHRPWGGHAFMGGGVSDNTIDVVSWQLFVAQTRRFRAMQLSEVWVAVFDWHLQNDAFVRGVDVDMLKADFTALTGKPFPSSPPVSEGESPAPSPGDVEVSRVAEPEPEPEARPDE